MKVLGPEEMSLAAMSLAAMSLAATSLAATSLAAKSLAPTSLAATGKVTARPPAEIGKTSVVVVELVLVLVVVVVVANRAVIATGTTTREAVMAPETEGTVVSILSLAIGTADAGTVTTATTMTGVEVGGRVVAMTAKTVRTMKTSSAAAGEEVVGRTTIAMVAEDAVMSGNEIVTEIDIVIVTATALMIGTTTVAEAATIAAGGKRTMATSSLEAHHLALKLQVSRLTLHQTRNRLGTTIGAPSPALVQLSLLSQQQQHHHLRQVVDFLISIHTVSWQPRLPRPPRLPWQIHLVLPCQRLHPSGLPRQIHLLPPWSLSPLRHRATSQH